MTSLARRLAIWTDELAFDALPPAAVQMAKRCVLDQLGVQVRGATLAHVQPALHLVREMGAQGRSRIAFHGDAVAASSAAYVNGTFGHSCEFDDSHYDANHPGAVILPAALAIAERERLSGEALIESLVVGYQVMTLAGGPIHRGMVKRGWHPLKVQGPFGAAAAVGKLIGLSVDQLTHALAISASDAGGTMEYDRSGGEVKRIHAGSAARSGLEAALLAARGLTGPETVLEGDKGIFKLFNDGSPYDVESYFGSDRIAILDTMFKLYPAVGTVHSALDAVHAIQAELCARPEDVRQIRVGMADWAIKHGATIVRPKDFVGAQFSLAFSVGLAVVHGANRLEDYLDPGAWVDPRVLGVADKVEPHPITFPGAKHELGAHVEVILADGRRAQHHQAAFRGHNENPATDQDIAAKFRTLTAGLLEPSAVDAIIARVADLEGLADISELTALAAGNVGAATRK